MACVAVLVFAAMAWAGPYQPGEALRISTVMVHGDPVSGDAALMDWTVVPQPSAKGETTLAFVMTETEREICRLVFSSEKTSPTLIWKENPRPIQPIQAVDLLVAPGSPVPCDVLPADMASGAEASRNYEVKREAGGQVFMDAYRVEAVRMDITEARSNGWLKGSGSPEEIVMVTMTSLRTGALVVRQLWAPGEDWWRFEETPFRQSWIQGK